MAIPQLPAIDLKLVKENIFKMKKDSVKDIK